VYFHVGDLKSYCRLFPDTTLHISVCINISGSFLSSSISDLFFVSRKLISAFSAFFTFQGNVWICAWRAWRWKCFNWIRFVNFLKFIVAVLVFNFLTFLLIEKIL
jgi:hypothetical protein